jgi:hypothetical protein
MRAPAFGDSTLAAGRLPVHRTPAEQFDHVAWQVMRVVVTPWTERLGNVELAVEEVPVLPSQWAASTVPLASYVEAKGGRRPRLVLFRRPLEHRAENLPDLEALLLTVIVEQLAEVLGIPPEDVLPGFEED